MMPQMDGFELAQKLKQEDNDVRFLFLTAKSGKEDKCIGYELGAEDYVTKPFDQDELLYKIKAILRRTSTPLVTNKQCQYSIGKYTFDPSQLELTYQGDSIRLTDKENSVLVLLCDNMNQILKRDDAVEEIYGKRDYFLGRSFDVFISRLRKHLNKDDSVSIENVYKVGFILSV
jgi:DNA-binding response OmpR family regulator